MSRCVSIALLLSTACSPDNGLKAFNTEPAAEITSHADGASFYEGYTETFRGSVTDPDHSADELVAIWYLGTEQVCPPSPPEADGTTTCDIRITAGDDAISLEVRDAQDAAGNDILSFTVLSTESPDAVVITPDTEGVYYVDQKITFTGILSDGEDAPEALVAYWESDLDGVLDVDAVPNADGEVEGFGNLTEGQHAIQLHVEDTIGKTGSASVIIDVGPPNSAPTCAITTPADGYAAAEGEAIRFEGQVDDVDVAEDWLTVTWDSDVDGRLRESAPASDGSVGFSGALTVATHRVTMTVTDEVGDTCTDAIYVSVGTPPTLIVSAPTSGDLVNEGEDVRFTATVSDSEDTPTNIFLSWNSDIDGEFSTQGADSSGNVGFSVDSLSTGDHVLTVRATDSTGLFAEHRLDLTINATPTAPTVSISPNPAQTDDDLTASASGAVDPDASGTVTYGYAWYDNGVISSASTSATFPRASTTKDHTYTVIVTPSDGDGDGETGEAEVTVENTDPVMTSTALDASIAVVGDTLTCSASATDADGDSLTISYTWSDGSEGDTYTVSADDNPSDTITCTATVDDGDDGTDSGTASATVDNTEPVLSSITVSPSAGQVGDTLTCTATATDADGGTPTITYAWHDGSTDPEYTIDSGDDPGDTLTCTATVDDGDGGTDSGTASATVDNTKPVLSSVTVSPASGVVGDTLTCSATATDADGGRPAITYAWQDGSTDSRYTIDDGNDPGDTLTCTATATDTDGGTAADSATATVDNTGPVMTSITVSPSTGQVGDTLTCSATATDADGGSPTITYAWSDGSTDPEYTIDADDDPGDTLNCTATATDASGSTDTGSAAATVDNTDPVMTSVTVSPSTGQVGDVLTCSATATDADGGSPAITYAWSDGSTDPEYTIDAGDDPGDTLTCTATAADTDGGTSVGSAVAAVDNTTPVLGAVTISPGSADNDSTLTCSSSATDADGGSPTIIYSWRNTTQGVGLGSGSSVDLSTTSAASEDTIQCTADAADADGGADSGTVDIVLDNRRPVLSVVLSPDPATEEDTLTCTATASDDDGDTLTATFSWTVAGSSAAATSTSGLTSTLSGRFDGGDTVVCTVEVDDDKGGGVASASDSLTIDRLPPVITSLSLSPDPAYTNDTLNAAVTVEDDEGSLVTTYDWYVDDGLVQSGTEDTLDGSVWFDKSQEVYVVVTVDDVDVSSEATSSTVTISNTPPEAPVVAITPEAATDGDALICVVDGESADDDGDTVTYTMRWTVDEVSYTAATTTTWTGDTVPEGDALEGEVWACTATPRDDEVAGEAAIASVRVGAVVTVSVSLAEADYTFLGEDASNYAGFSISGAGDVDGDDLEDFVIGAYLNDELGNGTGKTHLILGGSLGSSSEIDLSTADYTFIGENAGDSSGYTVSEAGDVDGDGFDDLLIGALQNRDGGTYAGKAYLILGGSLGSSSEIDLSEADYTFVGEGASNYLSRGLSSAGDVDGDGLDDILLGASGNSEGDTSAGKAYLILGSSLGSSSEIDLSTADYTVLGVDSYDYAGFSLSDAGDVDADGLDDFMIGAYGSDTGGTFAGAAYLFLGGSLGSVSDLDLSDADYIFIGESASDYAGRALSGAGDVDADGLDDLLIGAYNNDDGGIDAGKGYLILGSSLGSSSEIDLSEADYSFVGENNADRSCYALSQAGDFDGDGLGDLLLGAYQHDDTETNVGKAYLILGRSLKTRTEIDLASADYSFLGEYAYDYAAASVSDAGDVDGDGFSDIIVGAYTNDDNGSNAGKVYLFLGTSP